ncbi:BTB/POZ domain-containing protein 1-like [Pecten maximus]|uniref:BTB/POZ domain-containing protein 1-like n=1 Tax=Pecten maximus TaxID=6579 RepID=UPI001458CAE9|nr:BTB/POZ domain-containing protein 1-like [Pecten maximus]
MPQTKRPALDWQSGKSLQESLEHLLSNDIGSDVTFLVGVKRTRVFAHKLVISSRSPVFFAMFNGPLAETGDVEIPDINVETFLPFLRYLYTDQIDLTDQVVVPVMSVARKYCVDVLLSVCGKYLQKNLTPANACFLLEVAHIYTEDRLMAACLQVIGNSPQAILKSESFAYLCPQCVTSITESDELAVNESTLYSAVIKWAEKECVRQNLQISGENKRKVLGDILNTIRFPTMDQDFFLDKVYVDKILKNDEIVEILMYIRNKERGSFTTFNTKSRRMVYPHYTEGFIHGKKTHR